MELFEAIAQRYSYRGAFTNTSVPRSDLERIVQAGLQAPSACNGQVAAFVIVDDPRLLREIARIVDRPVCQTARAMIACIADPRPVFQTLSFAREDCAAAVQNILLAVTAMGYASVWLDGVLRVNGRAEQIARLLEVPAGKTVQVLLPVGIAAEPGQQREKLPFTQRAWFNHYGHEK